MPEGFSGEFRGVKEMKAGLDRIGNAKMRKAARKALREGQKQKRDRLIELAPVVSGITRDSIKVRSGKRRRNFITSLIVIGNNLFAKEILYSGWENYGHKWMPHKTHKGAKEPQPSSKAGEMIEGKHWLEGARDVNSEITMTVGERFFELIQAFWKGNSSGVDGNE